MDKETIERSGELVLGVKQEVFEFLTSVYNYYSFDKYALLESCDSAIQEIQSWKKAIKEFKILNKVSQTE